MSPVSRRSFLKGSSLFATALAAAAARGQDPPKQDSPKAAPSPSPSPSPSPTPSPREEERRKGPKTDEEIFAEQEKAREELKDEEGREYRVCPQCGFKMYRQGRTWTCSNCGFSYVE